MTEEEQGAAEWLRGIADKYQSEDGFGCREIVEMLGFCCDEIEMCNKCRVKAMKAIADRIDREMAEYELLKKENAELKAELADWKGNAEGFQPDSYMKLPLDADGVSINVGDTVYCDGEDEALTVTSISGVGGEYCCVTVKNADSSHCTVDALRLTHELPDSWRLWGDDLDAAVKVGEVDKVEMMRRAKALAKAGEGL